MSDNLVPCLIALGRGESDDISVAYEAADRIVSLEHKLGLFVESTYGDVQSLAALKAEILRLRRSQTDLMSDYAAFVAQCVDGSGKPIAPSQEALAEVMRLLPGR